MPDVISFGALAAPLHVQLGLSRREVREWQRDADAITRLGVRCLIDGVAGERAYTALGQRIRAGVEAAHV